ncbi:MAG: hypothetical protein IPO81_06200 [Kouleothrix sp.]|nr:hypothetical protein [Kouleothrix sp.]
MQLVRHPLPEGGRGNRRGSPEGSAPDKEAGGGQAPARTRRQGDKETRRQGDKETG